MRFCDTAILRVAPIGVCANGEDVIQFFQLHPRATICPIVDDDGGFVGQISRIQFQNRVASPFGRALLDKKPASELVDPNTRSVRLDDHISEALDKKRHQDETLLGDGFVVIDENDAYFGVITGMNIFKALHDENTQLVKHLKKEIAERREAENEVRRMADRDSLTGLLNRRAFLVHVDEAVRLDNPAACAFVDLDRFKQLNDEYGHAVGDLVLKTLGQRLRDAPRVKCAARLGGDEFAMLLDAEAAGAELNDLLNELHAALIQPISTSVGLVTVGASIGFAALGPDTTTPSSLMNAADKSMLRAKANGGGVERFDPKLDFVGLSEAEMERELRRAVFEQRIRPALQPILDLRTSQIVGYEVLARWVESGLPQNPGPAVFIPLAERAGLIDPLFWSLLDQALQSGRTEEGYLSLNVSPSQLASRRFVDKLREVIQTGRLDPARLQLEVTEHVFFRNIDVSSRILQEVKSLGIRLSMDDFGTGYSSLVLLNQLPFDKIKIDRAFTSATGTDGQANPILEATIALCDKLGLVSCAEGIENEETLNQLRALGCHEAQGYHIGRPRLLPKPTAASSGDLRETA